MPTLTFGTGVISTLDAILGAVDNALFVATLTGFTPTQVVLTAGPATYTLLGTGFTVGQISGQDVLTGGMIDSFTEVVGGILEVSITDFGLSALALSQATLAEESGSDISALETLLLNLDWTYNGNDNADVLLISATSGDGIPINLVGDDHFYLARGNDHVFMGDGDDRGYGDAGRDTLLGGLGRDRAYGQGNDDSLYGGADNDRLYGGAGNDFLSGDAASDGLFGGWGNDSLCGGDGNDNLVGDNDADRLYGGIGRDTLIGGLGNDTMDGGAGADTFVFTGLAGSVDTIENFSLVVDRVIVTAGYLVTDVGNGVRISFDTTSSVDVLGVSYNQYLADDSWISIG